MGWCHEFGPQIDENCEHPMTAHADRCECTVCGTVCTGRFAGCGSVWARGPRDVAVDAPLAYLPTSTVAVAERPVSAFVESAFVEPAPAAPFVEQEQEVPVYETPDVTARYAVAQLEELNHRVAGLTEDMTSRTEAALEKVYRELRRVSSQREVNLTEQAAGIFGAVQAGADALAAFSKTVGEVTDDLRAILNDALKAIGGTDGLAAWVATSATDLAETRQEFADSLAKIQRDMTLLRRRANAESKPARLDDDQLTFLVDAVTDSVVAALDSSGRRRR